MPASIVDGLEGMGNFKANGYNLWKVVVTMPINIGVRGNGND